MVTQLSSDYQGQTVLDLTTGEGREYLPEEAKKGCGFCWADYRFDEPSKILVVDGCVWACPYEFKFFDFSDPMNGWPEIEMEDPNDKEDSYCYVDADNQQPDIQGDTIKTYDTSSEDGEDTDDDGKPLKGLPIRAIKTFRREGLKLVFVEEWVSEEEKVRRVKRDEAERLYEEKMADFKATDPLYLACTELMKDPLLSPSKYHGVGVTYEGWCPNFKGTEQRWCQEIVTTKKKGDTRIEVEWGTVSAPIKLVVCREGGDVEYRWFDHSVEGMNQAFEYAKGVVRVQPSI